MSENTAKALRHYCWVCGKYECASCTSRRREAADEIERLRESERLALQGCDTASDAFEEQLAENNLLREQLSKNTGELYECRSLLREAVTNYETAHHRITENDHVDADFVDITLRRKWYEAAKEAGGE